jgi:ribonuclease Z
MEPIKITFLGTGNAVPTKKRNHSAILLNYKNESILIDCGEGTQRQFRAAEISPAKLTRILITHWHGDHILGLPGLFQTLAMNDYQKVLQVYGPRGTERYISLLGELVKIQIKIEVHEVSGRFIDENEFYVEAKPMSHGTPTLAYSFVIKDKLRLDRAKLKKLKLPNSPLLGKLQKGEDVVFNGKKIKASDVCYSEKGRKASFVLDTAFNENAVSLAKDSNLLICESSFGEEERELARERLHLTATDAARIAKDSKSEKLVLTHISQRYEHFPKIILDEAKTIFKKSELAKDFDVIEI